MKYGPVSYYRLGQSFPRSEAREFYRDHRKIRLIVATAPVRIPIHWATTGAAQGLGDGSSEANRIELKKAMENDSSLRQTLMAGDTINCKDDGSLTYNGSTGPFATLAVGGTNSDPIMVRGYITTPDDGGQIGLKDSNTGLTNHCFNFNSKSYWRFFNVAVRDCRLGYNMGTTAGHVFHNCIVYRVLTAAININAWVQATTTGDHCIWSRCLVIDLSGSASENPNAWDCNGRGNTWINCVSAKCQTAWSHIPVIHPGSFHRCIAWNCSSDGFRTSSTTLINCLSIKNTGNGFVFSTPDPAILVNCVAADNGESAISSSVSGVNVNVVALNCNLNPNDQPNIGGKISDVTLQEIDGFTEDINYPEIFLDNPLLLDFTPGLGSSLIESALDFSLVFTPDLLSFGTVGPIENQDTIFIGARQGIFRYYTGLLPVTKTEDLI